MKKLWVVLIGVLLLPEFCAAQDRTINGKVVSAEDGAPLPGISVLIKGTTSGVVTDSDGGFEIQVPVSAQVLVFTFIGLQTKEIVIGKESIINISMRQDAAQLSELVVQAICFERTPTPPTKTKRKKSRQRKEGV